MKARAGKAAIALVAVLLLNAAARATEPAHVNNALDHYVGAPDPSFSWSKRQEHDIAGGKVVELILTSQTWRAQVWRHQVFVFKPDVVVHPRHALLVIGGGRWKPELNDPPGHARAPLRPEVTAVAQMAAKLGVPTAAVLHVPFQPIFDDRLTEDHAVAHSFDQYLRTSDPQWPLLLPMVKSVVRAMDAVQALARDEWDLDVQKFTVTGASKRGWTTWLTAAVDDRVEAIVPIVFDLLNMGPQLEHQHEIWGGPSPSMHPYIARGVIERMGTPAGRELQAIVDPLQYRMQLAQPKLIVLATNDSFWPVDALNFYWDQLQGEKHILYLPNNGHSATDLPRVLGGIRAIVEQACDRSALPKLRWTFRRSEREIELTLTGEPKPDRAVAWLATSASRDFRESRWSSSSMEDADGGFSFRWRVPADEAGAIFGEAIYASDREIPLHLSTTVDVLNHPRRDRR